VATNEGWFKTIDGINNEERAVEFSRDDLAVYTFKDEKPATFDTFAVLIPRKGDNLKEFELFAALTVPLRGLSRWSVCRGVHRQLAHSGFLHCSADGRRSPLELSFRHFRFTLQGQTRTSPLFMMEVDNLKQLTHIDERITDRNAGYEG
jgi:hypothetical protein